MNAGSDRVISRQGIRHCGAWSAFLAFAKVNADNADQVTGPEKVSLTEGRHNMAGKFEIFRDKSGKFRWRLTHMSGMVIANSSESYTTKVNAVKGIWGTLASINNR
jgi:uncharacterized protein YegP (UPF0339 family)